jgi:hypothetical protein
MDHKVAKPGFANVLRTLHEDEDGMEAMQVVIIVSVAALVLLALYKIFWPEIRKWVIAVLKETAGMDFSTKE